MKKIVQELKDNSIISLIHRNEEGKFLVCKQDITENKLSLPTKRIKAMQVVNQSKPWKDYTLCLIKLMESQFGIRTKKLTFLHQSQNRVAYKLNNEIVLGDHFAYSVNPIPEYKGKLPPVINQTSEFKEAQYMTYNEIEEKFKRQEFDSNAFVFLFEYINPKVFSNELKPLLGKDPVVSIIHVNDEGKYMICRHKFNGNKLALPICRPVVNSYDLQYGKATTKDIFYQTTLVMRGEFGLNPEVLDHYNPTKVVYYYFNVGTSAHHLCFETKNREPYKGQPDLTPNPSGEFSDIRWVTLEEITQLRKDGVFDDLSYYFITEKIRGMSV